MAGFRLSTLTWKWLICALTAAATLLLIMDATHAGRALLLNHSQGTLGAELDDHVGLHPQSQGTYVLHIIEIAANSPLRAFGAAKGDRLQYDNPLDRWRRFGPGEKIGLTLIQPGRIQHLHVETVPTVIPFAEAFDYWSRLLLAVPALLFSVLIGVKQGAERAQRALALVFCALNFMLYVTINYMPAGPAFMLCKLAHLATYPLLWYWCVIFTLHYQPYAHNATRRWLWRLYPVQRALAFGTSAYAVWFGLGNEAPGLLPLTGAVIGIGLTICIVSLVDGWRQSSGEVRQRHYWLLLSFAFGTIPALLVWVPALDAAYDGTRVTIMVMFAGQFLMYIGLAYAVLKHRVFNFEFAVSRMLIFSVISVLLLCTFGVVERLSSSVLHGGGHADAPTITLVLDSLIALGVYLLFHHMHGRVERWVERIIFHQWHENEDRLRLYVKQAAHITSVDALLTSFRTALERFTGHAGCAIYLRQPNGDYELATVSTLADAPSRMHTDDAIAVALRADMVPQQLTHGAAAGRLALPMNHRGALHGFVLLGAKRDGEDYRPDECEALDFATRQSGLDLHALKVEMLEREVQKLTHHSELQGNELRLMAGRRKAPRELDSMQA
jgi:hypothetical protein